MTRATFPTNTPMAVKPSPSAVHKRTPRSCGVAQRPVRFPLTELSKGSLAHSLPYSITVSLLTSMPLSVIIVGSPASPFVAMSW